MGGAEELELEVQPFLFASPNKRLRDCHNGVIGFKITTRG